MVTHSASGKTKRCWQLLLARHRRLLPEPPVDEPNAVTLHHDWLSVGERVVQICTRENRHMAMMNKTRDWHENLKLRERDFVVVSNSQPSFHMAHVDVYLHRLGKFWEPSAPVKGFTRALQKRATVVLMDEYKSNKLCSLCHDTLEKARLLATNDDGEFELRKNRNILRCANSACRANF
jgi:hypothetical protein